MNKKLIDYENYVIYDDGTLINTTTNKVLQGKIKLNGYRVYTVSKNNIKKDFYAHRLVAEYFIPNPNNYNIVNHKDGNKLNNNVDNLEWTDQSSNMEHAHQHNLIKPRRKAEYYEEDLFEEEWKSIKDFPNYLVSNKARIRNINTNRILKPSIASGYYKIRLSNNGKVQDFILHHLVYKVFTGKEIPEGYVIDHIDGNKLNNNVDNLRVITRSENSKAAFYTQKTNSACKEVIQLTKDGQEIQRFPSCKEAARQLNLDASTIAKVCRGNTAYKSHGGFKFKYTN